MGIYLLIGGNIKRKGIERKEEKGKKEKKRKNKSIYITANYINKQKRH